MWFSRKQPPNRAAAPIPKPSPLRVMWNDSLGRAATRSAQVLLVLSLLAVFIFVTTQLTLVMIPVLLALILASACEPAMRWMRDKGLPSLLATVIMLFSIIGALTAIGWLITRQVRSQWDTLYTQAQEGIGQLIEWAQDLPFVPPPSELDEELQNMTEMVTDFLTSSQFGSEAIVGISATASFFTGLILMIVVLFFFLKDGPRIWEFMLRPFDGSRYARGRRIGRKSVQTMGGYIRGTAIVAAVDALGIYLGLTILGWVGYPIPLAIPLSVLVFILAFIPLVGATLAGTLAALVALVAQDFWIALIVVGIVIAVNQIEGNLLQPLVMARSMKLHALVVLLSLTIGTVLAGIVGAVLAVPIAAVIWGIIQVWDGEDLPAYAWRQKPRAETE